MTSVGDLRRKITKAFPAKVQNGRLAMLQRVPDGTAGAQFLLSACQWVKELPDECSLPATSASSPLLLRLQHSPAPAPADPAPIAGAGTVGTGAAGQDSKLPVHHVVHVTSTGSGAGSSSASGAGVTLLVKVDYASALLAVARVPGVLSQRGAARLPATSRQPMCRQWTGPPTLWRMPSPHGLWRT